MKSVVFKWQSGIYAQFGNAAAALVDSYFYTYVTALPFLHKDALLEVLEVHGMHIQQGCDFTDYINRKDICRNHILKW
jgi:hypothetical protein